jgi:hypothetical protein
MNQFSTSPSRCKLHACFVCASLQPDSKLRSFAATLASETVCFPPVAIYTFEGQPHLLGALILRHPQPPPQLPLPVQLAPLALLAAHPW